MILLLFLLFGWLITVDFAVISVVYFVVAFHVVYGVVVESIRVHVVDSVVLSVLLCSDLLFFMLLLPYCDCLCRLCSCYRDCCCQFVVADNTGVPAPVVAVAGTGVVNDAVSAAVTVLWAVVVVTASVMA